MLKIALIVVSAALWFAGLSAQVGPPAFPRDGAEQLLDNERVAVWAVSWRSPTPMQRYTNDALTLYLNPAAIRFTLPDKSSRNFPRKVGDVVFIDKGTTQTEEMAADNYPRGVVIELKDHAVAPIKNTSGHAEAFPRPGARQVFENDRVIVWDYTWVMGKPTPMHFHDKDVVVVYLETGSMRSTTPDGQSTVNDYAFGDARFNSRDRSHVEELVKGRGRALVTELK